MKSKALIFLLLFMCLRSFAQSGFEKSVILKFAPLSIMDYTPSIQFAVEKSIGSNLSVQMEAGRIDYRINPERVRQSDLTKPKGWRFRPELRLYFYKGLYSAFEVLFIKIQFEDTKTVNTQQVNYIAEKTVSAGHFKLGYQKDFGSHFIWDQYFGFGIRYVKYNPTESETIHGGWFNFNEFEGRRKRPSISLGCKIGYIFN